MAHEALDPRFTAIIDEHAPVRLLATGLTFAEGPLWHPFEGHLIFSDMPADTRRRWTPGRGVEEIQKPSNKGNGMTYDAALNLLVCEHSTSSVVRLRRDGTREVLSSKWRGRELNSPNDICVRADGSIYFTDPTYGRMPHYGVERPVELGFQGVYRLPAGHKPGDEPELLVDRYLFTQPNGLCFSPCERWMWVNDTAQANVRMFNVSADGKLGEPRIFAEGIRDDRLPGVPDGMKADIDGNVYVTGPGGIWVYDFHGVLLGKISLPEMPANLHWGGPAWSTLYICATTSLYAVETKTRGRIEPYMLATARSISADTRSAPNSAQQQSRSSGKSSPAPTLSRSELLRIEPARTALILQDLQNDVMMERGAFASTGAPRHAQTQNVVANARRLAEACRRAGVMVVHVWMICERGHPFLAQHAPLFQGLKGQNALVRGTWGARPAEGLEPAEGDLVVEKMSMSAWETSRLESYLHHGRRDTIINCGAWTNMSVEHTARTGADKGFRMIVPEDACSTMNAEWHNASIAYAMGNVAEIASVDAVIAALV